MTDATFSLSAGSSAVSPLRTFMMRLRQAQAKSRAHAELMLLDDRMLADIGLSRNEIWAAVQGGRGG